MLKIPAEYDRYTLSAKLKDISRQLPALLLVVSVTTIELWWMNQECTIDQKMATVHGTLCTIPPYNSNQYEATTDGIHSFLIKSCSYSEDLSAFKISSSHNER
jgi:hypothetical protein